MQRIACRSSVLAGKVIAKDLPALDPAQTWAIGPGHADVEQTE